MNHEKLEVYKQLIWMAGVLAKGMTKWPRGYGYLTDQLRRAMASSVLNLGEGNARRSSKERRRFFEISIGSIAEVGACVDLAHAFGLMKTVEQESFKSQLKLAYVKIRALP